MIDRCRTNAFEFVIIAGARAKQLMRGCTPQDITGSPKIIKIAQKEVREGKVEGRGRKRLNDTVALIALGVTGGIGAYKAVELARELQKRDHDRGGDDPLGAQVRGRVTFEAITKRRVISDQLRARRQCRHRAHRAGDKHRAPPRRPGDRQHHRQVRARHR